MPVTCQVGNRVYDSTKKDHAEEVMFNTGKYKNGNFTVEINAWPCTGERGHNCHKLFIDESKLNRKTITVKVTEDHGGYAANHGKPFGSTGTITYNDGQVTYS